VVVGVDEVEVDPAPSCIHQLLSIQWYPEGQEPEEDDPPDEPPLEAASLAASDIQ